MWRAAFRLTLHAALATFPPVPLLCLWLQMDLDAANEAVDAQRQELEDAKVKAARVWCVQS